MHFKTLEISVRFGAFFLNMSYVTWALDLTGRALLYGSPVTPELYGPLVYAIPAIVWFGSQMGSGIIACIGALIPGRWGMALIATGNLAQAVVFAFFAMASRDASMGVIVHTGSIHHAVPLALLSAGAAIYVEKLRYERR